jgi:hypothetical protein
MGYMGRLGLSAAQKADLWQRWKQGEPEVLVNCDFRMRENWLQVEGASAQNFQFSHPLSHTPCHLIFPSGELRSLALPVY